VKYKHIDSMPHNFGASFVSLINFPDREYMIDLLLRHARTAPAQTITINFSNGNVTPPHTPRGEYPPEFHQSIAEWRAMLPRQMQAQRIDANCLGDILFTYRLAEQRHDITVSSTDDRGIAHCVAVKTPFAPPHDYRP
jgi:hypothetical protein